MRISTPLLARIPRFVARAKPRFAPVRMTRTPGREAAASALPSADALSTTTISYERRAGAATIESRQRSRSARAL